MWLRSISVWPRGSGGPMHGATHPAPPPRGRSCGRGLWLEQGETDDLNTLLVFVCMLCDQMSVFYLWKKSIALECIAVLSHSFDLTHISTCSCQSHWHWIAHNTLTNNAISGLTCASLNSSTLPPPSSQCLHSDPEEQWLVSSEATLHLVLTGGVCSVCVWAAIRTWPLH